MADNHENFDISYQLKDEEDDGTIFFQNLMH